jgi:hypothetical protein
LDLQLPVELVPITTEVVSKNIHLFLIDGLVWFMVTFATFNNISVITWQSVLLVEETRGPGENHRPAAYH